MKNFILILSILFALPVFAQNHFIGIKGGVSWTNVVAKDFIPDRKSRQGFTGGLTYQYQLSKGFHLGADLIYAQKGFVAEVIFVDDSGYILSKGDGISFDYDYLSLPLKAGFSIGNHLSGFANIGVVPSVLINAVTTTPQIGDFKEVSNDVTDAVNKFDFGALVEMGASYTIKSRFTVLTSVQYQQDFISFTNENYFRGREARNYGITVSLGIRYALKAE